ncbi:hypothetical protein SUDANB95_03025 [Actinosynnema sp. ALI-1.44]
MTTSVEGVFGREYGRSVAVLVRVFGDIDLAEEAVQDAFAEAVRPLAGHRGAAQPGRLDHHHRLATGRGRYDQLMACAPADAVALNRAVAVAEVDGPAVATDLVDGPSPGNYHHFHGVRAELPRRLGRTDEAARAYRRAWEPAGNAAERSSLARSLSEVGGAAPPPPPA